MWLPSPGHVSNFRGLKRGPLEPTQRLSSQQYLTGIGWIIKAGCPELTNLEHRSAKVKSSPPFALLGPLTPRKRGRTIQGVDPISETYRYIVRSASVRSGNPIVQGTRIAVHDVIGLLQNGETVDTLRANCFPQLSRAQVYECLAYYEDHRGEIDLLVARQMALPPE